MNLAKNPTIAELKQLIMNCDDMAAHHIVWVDHGGNVNITPLPEKFSPAGFQTANEDKIKFRLETLNRGNEYVGITAANDGLWVENLYKTLVNLWAQNFKGYCDDYNGEI